MNELHVSCFAEKRFYEASRRSISSPLLLPTGRVSGRTGTSLLCTDMMNVSHASPARHGHYKRCAGALFIETLCMFSHETPDPSDRSPAEGSAANFVSSPAAAASEMLKRGEEKNVHF